MRVTFTISRSRGLYEEQGMLRVIDAVCRPYLLLIDYVFPDSLL